MKEFPRHTECIEYCKTHGLSWFGRDINEDFSKTHIAISYEDVYDAVTANDNCSLYEGMILHRPLKLFIDYDRKVSSEDSQHEKNVSNDSLQIKNDILNIIQTVQGLVPNIKDVLILKSIPDDAKKSYHIIFDGVHFSNHRNMKLFILETICPRFRELFDSKVIDTSVYRQGFFRALFCSKYGQSRPLHLLDTSAFMTELKEEVVPKSAVSFETFKKACVTYVDSSSVQFTHKSEAKKNSHNQKLHLVNDGDIYSDKEIIKKYLDILDHERFTDRNKWLNVGYILYSLSPDNEDLWHYFSAKWDNYNEQDCRTAWHSFSSSEYIYTLHSLTHLAKLDNPQEYEEITRDIPVHDLKFLRPFDNVMSKLVYRLFGERFVCSNPEKNEWYYFNSMRWVKENKSFNLRKLIINDVYSKIESYRKQLIKEGGSEELIKNYYRILEKISSGHKLNCLELEFYNCNFYKIIDQNKDLIGFENGIYDLATMEFRKGNPSDYVSMSTGYEFKHVDGNDPVYVEVVDLLKKILPHEHVRHFTLKSLASCLDGHIRDENFYIWSGKLGSGGNGKSTIMDLLLKSMGDYACVAPVTLITAKRESSNSANSALANIRNKRAVIMQEPEATEMIQAGVMKALTGGDRISTRELHSTQMEFKPHAKLFMACNKIPAISDLDGGVIRRLKITEFVSKFVETPGEQRNGIYEFKIDKDLKAKLEDYKSVFMCILLDYYRLYREEGLAPPEPVMTVTKKYENENNVVKQFIDENVVAGSKSDYITKDELRRLFVGDSTLRVHFGKFNNFAKQLETAMCTEFKMDKKRTYKISGFRIKQEEPDTDDEDDVAGTADIADALL